MHRVWLSTAQNVALRTSKGDWHESLTYKLAPGGIISACMLLSKRKAVFPRHCHDRVRPSCTSAPACAPRICYTSAPPNSGPTSAPISAPIPASPQGRQRPLAAALRLRRLALQAGQHAAQGLVREAHEGHRTPLVVGREHLRGYRIACTVLQENSRLWRQNDAERLGCRTLEAPHKHSTAVEAARPHLQLEERGEGVQQQHGGQPAAHEQAGEGDALGQAAGLRVGRCRRGDGVG